MAGGGEEVGAASRAGNGERRRVSDPMKNEQPFDTDDAEEAIPTDQTD